MGPKSTDVIFLTKKKSFLHVLLIETDLVLALSVVLYLIARNGPSFDFELICLIGLFLMILYGILQASIMLYEVTFFSDRVRLEFYYLCFFRKTIEYKFEDIRVVLCRPKHKVLTIYKKGLLKLGISTSLNKNWQKEQIIQMAQIFSEHNVPVKQI